MDEMQSTTDVLKEIIEEINEAEELQQVASNKIYFKIVFETIFHLLYLI